MGPTVPNEHVKFGGPCTHLLEKFNPKPSEATFSTFFCDNIRPDVDSDVISGADAKQVSIDVRVKLSDSRSNQFRDI